MPIFRCWIHGVCPKPLDWGTGAFDPAPPCAPCSPNLSASEENLREVLAGRRADLNLPNINREDDDGSLQYWDLLVLRDAQTGDGLLLIRDVTSRGRMVRELNQRRYDSLLYRGVMKSADSSADQRLLGTSPAMESCAATSKRSAGYRRRRYSCRGRPVPARAMWPGSSITIPALPVRLLWKSTVLPCRRTSLNRSFSDTKKGPLRRLIGCAKGFWKRAKGEPSFSTRSPNLPVNLQAKLLTAIETKEIRRLGGGRPLRFRARIIAATNRDLQEEIRNRRFRQDLFFRLNVAPLTIPALRHLDRDVLQIAEHFIRILNAEFGKRVEGLSAASQNALMDHPWPGNIRELRNCIERAMIFVDEGPIDVADLMLMPPAADAAPSWSLPAGGLSLESVERHLIQSAMDRADGNKTRAAALLGLTRDTLRYRLEKFSMG